MKKTLKIISFIIILNIWLLLSSILNANSLIPIQDAFNDIKVNYKYYNELQTLYNKWMIFPEDDGGFHPEKLLHRDDFVAIAKETSCSKCIIPYVDKKFIDKYKTKPFYDVWLDNKNFFCISDAKENNFIRWYQAGVKCNDWTQKDWEVPFCSNNNIKLEEALAIIMKMWGILTSEEYEETIKEINEWWDFPDLSLDVKAKINGYTYSFYPYFEKALKYQVVNYDTSWNKNNYKLLEKKWDYLRPNQLITKEDFLKMAYIALKANSCLENIYNNLAIQINIFESDCNIKKVSKWECNISDLNNNTFDFNADVWWICEKGINFKNWYIWRFLNEKTWKQTIKYGQLIDNYTFLDKGKYKVFLRATDNCWNTGDVYNTLNISWENEEENNDNENNISVSINASPITWDGPLEVNLEAIIDWWKWPYKYKWDFWDGSNEEWQYLKHIFIEEWIYEVILVIIDSEWNNNKANIFIKILDNNCSNDFDLDWIKDCEDKCPLIKGTIKNEWCPIFNFESTTDDNLSECIKEQENTWYIYWNVVCDSCPCTNSISFRSTLRKCDNIFPAITSKSERSIYSRGTLYQIK